MEAFMKVMSIVKSLVSILILTLVLHPTWGAEKLEPEGKDPQKGMTEIIELDGPIALQIATLVDKKLKAKDELDKAYLAKVLAPLKDMAFQTDFLALKRDFEEKMATQKKKFDEDLAAQKREFDASLKSQIEHISKIIKQEPPSFVQRITPNKYIWAVSGLTLLSVTVSFAHHCDGFWSIPYATWMSAAENLPLLINLYYGAKIVQESTSVKGILASQAAQ